MKVLIISLLSLLFVSTGFAQNNNFGINTKAAGLVTAENSFLYSLDVAIRNLQLAITFTPEAKAKLALQIAEERLAEAYIAAQENDSQSAIRASKEYKANIEIALDASKQISSTSLDGQIQAQAAIKASIERINSQLNFAIDRSSGAPQGALVSSRIQSVAALTEVSAKLDASIIQASDQNMSQSQVNANINIGQSRAGASVSVGGY